MGVKISKIESVFPENILTNEDLSSRFPEWTPEIIENKIGIVQRHVVDDDETALDLAVKAGEKILADYDKETIDFLILCTQSPDYYLPTSACILQEKLGLPVRIGAFDFNLGCSGYIYGLGICKGLVESKIANKILFITAETYTKKIHPLDKGNLTLFGDAATASLIEYSEEEHILDFVLGTDGSGASNLIISNGGARNKCDKDAPIIHDNGSPHTANDLYMNGPEIFTFTIQRIPKLIDETLKKHQLKLEDIHYFVFHQANKYMLDYLREKMKVPADKFYMNMRETGNTVSSTIPIALKDCIDQSKVKKGDLVLLAGFGVGYSWGATIIKI
ncbi:3-oxoacyl-ACP synthase [Bacteroidia bacterium]|nr:3-oxoacyl-ACP synthase [Bacteroidia bacterium]